MYDFAPPIQRAYTRAFAPLARFFHVRLGLSPNQVSWISFFFSMLSIVLLFAGQLWYSAGALLIALFFDAADGSMARIYGLQSNMGQFLEFALDGIHEFLLYLGLAYLGYITYLWFFLLLGGTLLVKIYRTETGFDPGFRRVSYFFGLIVGFELIAQAVFFWSITGFLFQLGIKFVRYYKHRKIMKHIQ